MTEEPEPGQSASVMVSVLHWAFDQATSKLPGIGSAEDLARSHLANCGGSAEKAIAQLITWQVRYAGALGFATNLGGLVTMPVTVPANLASVLLIQLRMIAAIAILRGYKVNDHQVRTLAFLCVVGSGAADLLQEVSIGLGTRLSTQLIMKISGKTLTVINQAVGVRLITKAGATGLIGLTRIVPFIGGLIGGGFDAIVTRGIGAAAKMTFQAILPENADDAVALASTTALVVSEDEATPKTD
jgi:EcsC protein family